MKVKNQSEVAQPYPTLRNPMDCSLPGPSVHGISQARVLGWGATAFSARIPRARRILEKFIFLSCRLEAGVPDNGTHSFFPLNLPPTRGKCQAIPIVRCKGCCFFLLRKGTAKEGWHWQPHREGRGDQLTFQLFFSLSLSLCPWGPLFSIRLSCLRTRLDLEVAVPCPRDQVLQLKKGLLCWTPSPGPSAPPHSNPGLQGGDTSLGYPGLRGIPLVFLLCSF